MEWIEVEAATKDDAEAKLLETLGESDINSIEIENVKVVRKFLGMGGKMVKLRGRKKTAPPPLADSAPHVARARVREQETGVDGLVAPVPAEQESDQEMEPALTPKPAPSSVIGEQYHPWRAEGPGAIVIPPEGKGFGGRLYSQEPVAGEEEPETCEEDRGADIADEEEFTPTNHQDDPASPVTDEDRDKAITFIKGMLEGMDIQGEVKGFKLAERLMIQIESDGGGLLIGRKGETLDALQYMTDIVINRGREKRIRLTLDTENYREHRKHKVILIARESANRAVQSRKPVRLAPMTPAERQIVHSTLAEDGAVETISEGQGNRRRVVVYPGRRRR